MLLIRLSAAVREDSSAFCFPFYGHGKRKIPRQAVCLPWEMKGQSCDWRALRLNLAASARALAAACAAAAGRDAAREVVAGKDDLEVVGDEGAHEAVRIADFVLRLVRLHHGNVGIRAIRRFGRWAVLLPPRRGKLRLLLESGANDLLHLGFRVVVTVTVGTIGLARLLIHAVNHALLGAQLT